MLLYSVTKMDKQLNKNKTKGRFGRLIGIPLLAFAVTIIFDYEHFFSMNVHFWNGYIVSLIITSVLWIGNYEIFLFARKYFHDFHDTKKRILYQTSANFLFTLLISIVVYFACCRFTFFNESNILKLILATFIPTIIMVLVYETIYTFHSWKDHINETESLKVENIKSQLNSLRAQLDPHFLFNSLNTLVSLVGEQNKPAQEFLFQLSDVYRYVLVNRENNVVSLKEEIAFSESYIYLNKIRFRNNIQVELSIHPSAYLKSVAPLSLQMLIENALKHNAATTENPLKIKIESINDEYIRVTNTLHAKKTLTDSIGVGLNNIINRYKLLTTKEVVIVQSEETFSVDIPLLP